MAEFQKAVELEHSFADAYYQIGICQEKQGKREKALKMYEKAVEVLPDHLDGLVALMRIMKN